LAREAGKLGAKLLGWELGTAGCVVGIEGNPLPPITVWRRDSICSTVSFEIMSGEIDVSGCERGGSGTAGAGAGTGGWLNGSEAVGGGRGVGNSGAENLPLLRMNTPNNIFSSRFFGNLTKSNSST